MRMVRGMLLLAILASVPEPGCVHKTEGQDVDQARSALIVASSPGSDALMRFFGPQSSVRTGGKPQTQSLAIRVPSDARGPFTLHVESSGVSSAVVSLNARSILQPNNFPLPGPTDVPVTLNPPGDIR